MNKNCLIFGGGSKFGLCLSNTLSAMGYNVYVVTSTPSGSPIEIVIDWYTCNFIDVERFLKKLPAIDLLIFNQNFCQTPGIIDLGTNKPQFWKQGKEWMQSHFVNSILPCQVLTTLTLDKKFTETSVAAWMLSDTIFKDDVDKLLGYRAQKRLNKDIIKNIAKNNKGRFIGIYPGKIDVSVQGQKAQILSVFLATITQEDLFYRFNDDNTALIPHPEIIVA